MKTEIATTKEQSRRLLACGVSPDTADMCWTRFESDGEKYEQLSVMDESAYEVASLTPIPAWGLSSLLGLLPKEMGIAVGAYPDSDKYTCFTLIDPDIEPIVADTAIEATVQMIEQFVANGYKLNEI